jgi:hypothetical protein
VFRSTTLRKIPGGEIQSPQWLFIHFPRLVNPFGVLHCSMLDRFSLRSLKIILHQQLRRGSVWDGRSGHFIFWENLERADTFVCLKSVHSTIPHPIVSNSENSIIWRVI